MFGLLLKASQSVGMALLLFLSKATDDDNRIEATTL